MQYDSLKQMPAGGLASFLTSNMDEIEDNVLAFGAPRGINSMVDVGNRMAMMGRNGDDQLVHARSREVMVSPEILEENPKLANELTKAFDRSNVDMARYEVGNPANSINPMTGQREFFLKKLIGGIKDIFKKIAPVVIPMGLNMLFPGLGTVASGALGAGIGTLVQGGSFKDALKSAALGGVMGGVSAGIGIGGPAGAEGFKERAFGALGGMDTPIVRPGMFGTPKVPPSASPVTTTPTAMTSGAELSQGPTPGASSSVLDKAKDFYGEYLSPNRNVLNPTEMATEASKLVSSTPALTEMAKTMPTKAFELAMETVKSQQPGMIARYAPLALAGTAVFGAAGGFETPKEDLGGSPFGISSQELYDQNPSKYSVFAGYNMPTPMSRVSQPVEKDDRDYIFQSYLQPQYAAEGGAMNRQGQRNMALEDFPRRQGYIAGPGTETSDDIPAMLSDGEFVMTARAVRGLGDGSRKRGVKKMYDMMRAFEGGVVA
jgi:hypothetical protein